MKAILSILFLVIFLFNGSARWSPNPYRYTGIGRGLGSPFTKVEFELIKKHKIKRINIPTGIGDFKEYVEFLFDNDYQLDSSYWYFYGKKGRVNQFQISYEFDKEERLVSTHKHMGEDLFIDSVSYDKIGRLIYLKYSPIVFGKKKNMKQEQEAMIQEYRLLDSDSLKVILIGTSASRIGNTFYINNNNQNYIHISKERIDSISFGISNKKYWYKHHKDSIFRLGLYQEYENDLLKSETTYVLFYEDIIKEKIIYIYNEQNQLMRSYNDLNLTMKKFYFYNEFGLIREEINVSLRGESDITKFDYFKSR